MHALKTGVSAVVHHCATSQYVMTALYQPRDERLESPIMWLCFMCILCCLEKHLLYIIGNMLCVVYKWYLFLSVSYQIRKCVHCGTGNRGLCLCISAGSVMSQFKSPKPNLSWLPSQMWFVSESPLDWNQHLVKVIEMSSRKNHLCRAREYLTLFSIKSVLKRTQKQHFNKATKFNISSNEA